MAEELLDFLFVCVLWQVAHVQPAGLARALVRHATGHGHGEHGVHGGSAPKLGQARWVHPRELCGRIVITSNTCEYEHESLLPVLRLLLLLPGLPVGRFRP